MARFLLACYPIAGHRTPNIAIGHALAERGHEVAIYSGSMARPSVEQAGLAFFPFHQEVDERITKILLARDEASFAGGVSVKRASPLDFRKTSALMSDWFLSTVPQQVRDLQDAIDDWQPDVLVTDFSLFGQDRKSVV